MKLTAKQIRFVDEYMVDFNATQAAIRAGYSPKTAAAAAARLLRNVNIQAEIARRQKNLQRRTEISQDRVVKELARIAFADASDYACIETYMYENKEGSLTPIQVVSPKDTGVLSDDQRAAIAGIKQGANGIEIKLHDKIKALELLGRHIGMFNDKLSLSGTDGGPLTFRWEGKDG
mgnify:CR=1 FL=1